MVETVENVDVVLLTKNSERVLKECVESVYRNVPVGQLIVVDGYSEDKTIQILDEFNKKYHNIKIVLDRGTRATARQKGISQVKTDWFMFVDSDVVLCQDWFKKARKYISPDVGAIWGIEVWSTIQKTKTLKLFLVTTRKIFDARGGTHDTLIRKNLVEDLKIPENLHVFEDAFIKDWIEDQGFRVIACYDPFCIHYRPKSVWTIRGSLGLIVDAFRFGHPRLIGKLVLAYGFYTAYSIYQVIEQGDYY